VYICAAAEALLWIGLDLLKQGDAKSRLRGVQGLGEFGNRMGMHVPALDAALKDGDERVRHAAAEALKKIQETQDETERLDHYPHWHRDHDGSGRRAAS